MTDCHVYLVPGFFGFQSFGSYNYFNGPRKIIESRLETAHGIKAMVIDCKTQPTASLTARAKASIEEIVQSEGHKARALHFVGHSTGGLDARLLLSPGVNLRDDSLEFDIAEKTKSLTTVSTPHYGTPVAGFFTTFQGKHVLNILTTLASDKRGRQGIYWAAQAAGLVAKIDDYLGLKNTILDELGENLLKNITLDEEDPFWKYLKTVQKDQGALIQLTPEAMDLFNAAVVDAPNVTYQCVISAARRPSMKSFFKKAHTPSLAGSMALFFILREITSRPHRSYPYPEATKTQASVLEEALSFDVDESTNDGVSPCLSQIYGNVITAANADHLDIVGQFARKGSGQKYSDWMYSNSGFNEIEFKRVWETIADGIAKSQMK